MKKLGLGTNGYTENLLGKTVLEMRIFVITAHNSDNMNLMRFLSLRVYR